MNIVFGQCCAPSSAVKSFDKVLSIPRDGGVGVTWTSPAFIYRLDMAYRVTVRVGFEATSLSEWSWRRLKLRPWATLSLPLRTI